MGSGDRVKWTWARLGDISLAKEVLTWASMAKLALGVLGAGALTMWAHAESFPPPVLALFGLFAFAALIWAMNGVIWAVTRRRRQAEIVSALQSSQAEIVSRLHPIQEQLSKVRNDILALNDKVDEATLAKSLADLEQRLLAEIKKAVG